jgi:hypothetical protein
MSAEERKKLDQLVALFQKYSDQYGFDWLALGAQAYQESELNYNRRSRTAGPRPQSLVLQRGEGGGRKGGQRAGALRGQYQQVLRGLPPGLRVGKSSRKKVTGDNHRPSEIEAEVTLQSLHGVIDFPGEQITSGLDVEMAVVIGQAKPHILECAVFQSTANEEDAA